MYGRLGASAARKAPERERKRLSDAQPACPCSIVESFFTPGSGPGRHFRGVIRACASTHGAAIAHRALELRRVRRHRFGARRRTRTRQRRSHAVAMRLSTRLDWLHADLRVRLSALPARVRGARREQRATDLSALREPRSREALLDVRHERRRARPAERRVSPLVRHVRRPARSGRLRPRIDGDRESARSDGPESGRVSRDCPPPSELTRVLGCERRATRRHACGAYQSCYL